VQPLTRSLSHRPRPRLSSVRIRRVLLGSMGTGVFHCIASKTPQLPAHMRSSRRLLSAWLASGSVPLMTTRFGKRLVLVNNSCPLRSYLSATRPKRQRQPRDVPFQNWCTSSNELGPNANAALRLTQSVPVCRCYHDQRELTRSLRSTINLLQPMGTYHEILGN